MATEENYKKIVLKIREEVESNLKDLKLNAVESKRTSEQQAYIDGYNLALTLILNMISDLQWQHSFEFRIEKILNDLGYK